MTMITFFNVICLIETHILPCSCVLHQILLKTEKQQIFSGLSILADSNPVIWMVSDLYQSAQLFTIVGKDSTFPRELALCEMQPSLVQNLNLGHRVCF